MRIIIFLLGLLICVHSGEYKSECNSHPACALCSIEWNCEYGQDEAKQEECYQHCLANAIDYDEHENVIEGQETKVHQDVKSLIQSKQKQQGGPAEIACKSNQMCEECALSYFCDYGNDPYEKELCYKDCQEIKNDYDYDHSQSQRQKGVQVHAQIKTKQQDNAWKKKCLSNTACEACSLSWQCEYGQKQELIDECYKVCTEHQIDFDSHSSVTGGEEVKVH